MKQESHQFSTLIDRLSTEVDRVIKALEKFSRHKQARQIEDAVSQQTSPTQAPKALDKTGLQTVFQELSDCIDEHDADVIKRVSEFKTLLGPSNISDSFSKLESLINSFKFTQAKEMLKQVAKELNL